MLLGKFSLLSFWRSQSIFIFSCHRKQMGKFLKNLFVLVLFCCFCLPSLYKKCVCKTMSLISELNLQVVINRQPGSIITSEKWVDLKIQKRLLFFGLGETILINACQTWIHIPVPWGSCYKVYSDLEVLRKVWGLKVLVSNKLSGNVHGADLQTVHCVARLEHSIQVTTLQSRVPQGCTKCLSQLVTKSTPNLSVPEWENICIFTWRDGWRPTFCAWNQFFFFLHCVSGLRFFPLYECSHVYSSLKLTQKKIKI